MAIRPDGDGVRIAELVAALSYAADLRETLVELYDRREPGEYLVVLGRKG